jgi:hypothetical protein
VKPHFMVSYAQHDAAAVRRLTAKLSKHGFSYFIDEKDIEPGSPITQAVHDGIRNCTHVLAYVSGSSLRSQWVMFELGVAFGLGKTLIFFVSDPGLELPKPLAGIKYIKQLPEFDRYLKRLADDKSIFERMTPVEQVARERLYYHPGGWASAIRLFGAGDDALPWSRVVVSYVHAPLDLPPTLIPVRDQAIKKRREAAIAKGQVFFDGPNTRLLRWRASPRDDYGSARELVFLELTLAPVGWYDFEGLNDAFRETLPSIGYVSAFESFIGLSALVSDGDVSKAQLSNILDNAVTVITSDGYVGYQQRGARTASVPGRLTSAVAENVNRYLDETDGRDQRRRLHPLSDVDIVGDTNLASDYQPAGVPHPFAAAERGIRWELSPDVMAYVGADSLRLTGLSFDPEALHPNFLYLLALPITKDRLVEICSVRPGKEAYEGRLMFMRADAHHPETQAILVSKEWIPAGKASVLRAFEVLDEVRAQHRCDVEMAVQLLSGTAT